MVKRVFKKGTHQVGRMFKWVRCLQYKSHRKQSDHRAVALAVHAVQTGRLGRPRLTGGHN